MKFDEKGTPKYIQLYRNLKSIIESRKLKPSEKLPPLREISSYLHINISTAVKAYELLEKERYIYKKGGSGCYVYPHSNDEDSLEKYIRFDLANPKSTIFPIEKFKKAVEIAMQNEGSSLFDYQEGLGYEPLRESICIYIGKEGIRSEKDKIQIISGAQQGINIIVNSMLSYGDIIFIEEPSYPGAIEVFKEHGIKVVGIPLLDDGIDIGLLKIKAEKFRPSFIYTMPNYHNPTGISYTEKKKKDLIKIAKEYDFMIIEDDYMSDFDFSKTNHIPIRAYDLDDRVIYLKSFSKILMPGLRIGFMEMPQFVRNIASKVKYNMDISTSSFTQLALYYYMKYYNWDEHLRVVEHIYKNRFDKALYFIENNFKGLVNWRTPCGGINFFFSMPKDFSSIELKEFLERKNIKILEGTLFYSTIKSENEFRISIAHMEEEEVESNLKLLKKALEEFLSDEKNKMKYKIPNLS